VPEKVKKVAAVEASDGEEQEDDCFLVDVGSDEGGEEDIEYYDNGSEVEAAPVDYLEVY
jgi:hypothetical protein